MTGDDHNIEKTSGFTGTPSRFNDYRLMSKDNSQQAVEDWKAIRATSYVYDNINLSNDSVLRYQSLGFEIAFHPTTACANFTRTSLSNDMTSQLARLETKLPGMLPPVTNRTHCMPWSDWASQPKIENSLGIRFDVNYYYWPGSWIQNRPGLFTGSGMPMRFADSNGTLIDCYQAPTQIPDESGLDITNSINTLLDNAINKGYYGAFVMNMHTDTAMHIGSDQIITAAMTRQVPVVSSRQMLTWLDNRNGTDFSHVAWDNVTKTLTAGHVCTVMGTHEYPPLAERFGVPIVVTGFEPLDILEGIRRTVHQLEEGRARGRERLRRARSRPRATRRDRGCSRTSSR